MMKTQRRMMMNRRLGYLVSTMAMALTVFAGGLARAQERTEIGVSSALKGDTYVGAQIGIDFLGDTNYKCRCDARQSDFLLYGGRFGHFFTDHVALEATVNWIDLHPGFYDASLGIMYDFTPTQRGWNTYLGIGGGSEREHVHGRGEGFAYIAFGSEYRFNRAVGARFELRGQHVFGEPFVGGSSHNDIQPNVGVVLHFGAPAAAMPPPPPEMPKSSPPPPPPMAAPAPPAAEAAPAAPPAEAPPPPVVAPPPAPQTSSNDVPFDRRSSRLTNIAKAVLDRVAARLKDDLTATVVVTGYPDEGTSAGSRETLATQRAENVKKYLTSRHGIDAGRITTRTDTASPATAGKAVVTITFQSHS